MTGYLSENNYNDYLALKEEFENILVSCAQEICQISKGRKMIGEFNGDIDMYAGKYCVVFEEDEDAGYDIVYVPKGYTYNKVYRRQYQQYLVREREREAQEAQKREEERKAHTYHIVTDERAEYERLKVKFENDDRANTPNITPGRCDMT